MVTSSHPADDDRIFFKEARSLVKAGAHVLLLCGEGKRPPQETFGVRFASYYGGRKLLGRALTIRRLEEAIAERQCDIVHCHEADSLIAALRVKQRFGVRVIFDSHELWAGVMAERFPPAFRKLVGAVYGGFEQRWVAACDAAIGASNGISEHLSSMLGPERVATILNVPVVEVFGEQGDRAWGEETILCHDGCLTFERGLKTMAKAVRLLATRHKVKLKIVGDVFGEERRWLDSFVAKHHLERNIVKTGWLPYEDVGRAIAPCHIGLVCFLPSANHRIAAPNKCFNYLLYGLPVVGPDYPESHFATLKREGCAVLTDPTSPEVYAEAISKMILDRESTEKMAGISRMLSRSKYRWEHMEPVLFSLYEQVIEARAANGS
jgi:glycosyltransferase involved in cell wall biosynthesis